MSQRLLACGHCDELLSAPVFVPGQAIGCPRCGGLISRFHHVQLDRAVALSSAGLVFLLCAALYPFLGFSTNGQYARMSLLDSAGALLSLGEPALGTLVFLFIFLAPGLLLILLLWLLIWLMQGRRSRLLPWLGLAVRWLAKWNMAEVFLLGVLVSVAKITSMATVHLGASFWAFVGFSLCTVAALATLDQYSLWRQIEELTP